MNLNDDLASTRLKIDQCDAEIAGQLRNCVKEEITTALELKDFLNPWLITRSQLVTAVAGIKAKNGGSVLQTAREEQVKKMFLNSIPTPVSASYALWIIETVMTFSRNQQNELKGQPLEPFVDY